MADNDRDMDMKRNAFCFAASQGDVDGMKPYLKSHGMNDPVFGQVIMSALASAVMAEQPVTTQFTLGHIEQYRIFPEKFIRDFFKKDSPEDDAFLNQAVDEYKVAAKALDDQRNNFCAASAAGDMAEVKNYLTNIGTKDSHFDMVLMTGFSLAHFNQHMEVAKTIYTAAEQDSTLPRTLVTELKELLDGKKPPTLGDNFGPTGKGLNPNR